MGTFTHPITLHSTSGDQQEVVQALVDTGSTFTAVPVPILERLGATAQYSVRLKLANGQTEVRHVAEIKAELVGERMRTIMCVFGDAESPPTIGAHTLEAFLLSVDPVDQRLVPVEGYWL